MNLFYKRDIQILLKEHGFAPSKGLGQNFLINKKVAEKIIKAADLKIEDIVLEIGPGIGNLTQELAKSVKKVIAVEKDRKMVEILKGTLKNYENIEVVSGDILKIFNFQFSIATLRGVRLRASSNKFSIFNFQKLNYKVVANLPYYITSPVIRKFLESDTKPEIIVLTIQKEVAQRICSKPPKMNLLAVSVQFYAKPEIVAYIKKENFWPKPKVNSAIIKITPHKANGAPPSVKLNGGRGSVGSISSVVFINAHNFFKVVKAGFSQPRKQLVNNLSRGLKIEKGKVIQILLENNIKPSQRAETLTVEDWIKIASESKPDVE